MDGPIEDSPHQRSIGTALVKLLREIGAFALIGLVSAVILLALFAKLSEDVFTNEFSAFDNNVALWVHSFASSTLDALFNAFSILGGTVSIAALTIVAFGLLMWRGYKMAAWRLALAIIGGVVINEALKFLFHRARPELWATRGEQVAGFSFPSGHAALSLCLFGMFIWLGWRYLKRPWARVGWTVLMLFLIAMVGLSRIYLGAHYPSDVLAGYLSGTIWLIALLSGADIYHRLRVDK